MLDQAVELWNGFIGLPTEYQVAIGVGGLICLAALRNIWGMLYPVRFLFAGALRGIAFVAHPRKQIGSKQSNQEELQEAPVFNVSTPEQLKATLKYYVANTIKVQELSDDQINVLDDLCYSQQRKESICRAKYPILANESRRRRNITEMRIAQAKLDKREKL